MRGGVSTGPGRPREGREGAASDSGPISPTRRVSCTQPCAVHQPDSPTPEPPHSTGQVAFRMITCSEFGKGKARTWALPAACSLSLGGGGLSLFALILLTWKLESRYKFRRGEYLRRDASPVEGT